MAHPTQINRTIDALLHGAQRDIQQLAQAARSSIGEECPHCGSRADHDHNVDSTSFICAECGEIWDRDDYT